MTSVRRVVAVAVFALGAAVGCGGGAIPFPQFEPTALAAVCRLEVLCQAYPDQVTCMTSEQIEPHFYDTLGKDIAGGKVIYDGASARACVDAINGFSSCSRSAFATIDASPACSKIFTGTVATGGACFFGEECAGQGTCGSTSSCAIGQCCAGTCQAGSVTVQLGGDCSRAGTVCTAGTICLGNSGSSPLASTTQTCQNPVQAGGACANLNACAAGLYCDANSQTCKAQVATGGACDPSLSSTDCESEADHCDATTMTCTPPLAIGSPCANSTQSCVSYATCDATSGTCIARPDVGAACDATNGPNCLGGTCDASSGSCMLEPIVGACS
jgi:hypothetical protein